jgi:hypothetical protein
MVESPEGQWASRSRLEVPHDKPTTGQQSGPLTYGPPYMAGAGRGFDDVVFDGSRGF